MEDYFSEAQVHPVIVAKCLQHLYRVHELVNESAETSKDDSLYSATAELDQLAALLTRLLS